MKSCPAPLAGKTLAPVIATVGKRLVGSVPNGTVTEILVPLRSPSIPKIVNCVMSFALLGATLTATVYAFVVRSAAVTV